MRKGELRDPGATGFTGVLESTEVGDREPATDLQWCFSFLGPQFPHLHRNRIQGEALKALPSQPSVEFLD